MAKLTDDHNKGRPKSFRLTVGSSDASISDNWKGVSMSTALDGIRLIVETREPVGELAILSAIVISKLPDTLAIQFPLEVAKLKNDEVTALMLLDETEVGDVRIDARFQVGVELPADIDSQIERPFLVHRNKLDPEDTDKPFEHIWLFDLWSEYLIPPQRVVSKILGYTFTALNLMPAELKSELDAKIFNRHTPFIFQD